MIAQIRRRLADGIFTAAALLVPATAFAQNVAISAPSRPFAAAAQTDLAQAWLNYLFRGDALPDEMAAYAAPLAFAANGLREAMGLYSVAMLIFAALLVFYHLAAMVVETAHSGIPFGRRANQIWMPIRFVIAIGLLVPVSSSLSAGQYLVLRIAAEGSNLASNAWRTVASVANGHLSGLVTPRGPDVAHLAATAIEMETCRSLYAQIYAPLANETAVHLAGNIGEIAKLPADRFMGETWRYTNVLNTTVPLCGEYRFIGYRHPVFGTTGLRPDAPSRMAEALSTFAHSQAEDLETQAHSVGDSVATSFMSAAAPIGADAHADISRLESSLASSLDTEQRDISTIGAGIADQTLVDSVNGGWIAAASFIPEFVRLQESYSELVSHALPIAEGPIFAHPHMTRQALTDAVVLSPLFLSLQGATPEQLVSFYSQVGRVVTQVHAWLYATQLADTDYIAPSSADLSDRLNAATDPEAAAAFFAQAFDAAAFTSGVWGEDTSKVDTGYPFAAVPPTASFNPFGALVEFGRRQIDLATKAASLSGTGLSTPGATGPSVLLGIASICFLSGGLLLIFVAPLLPFLRFLIAALAWGINVFEAVVAVPIVALAHLTPVGGGLSGSMARQAYMLWLGLLVRPVLTLFGFVFGLLLFVLSIAFIGAVLTPFARLAMPTNGALLVGANAGLVLLYDVLIYAAANASFKGISWLPDQALRWTSQFVVTDPGESTTQVTNNTGGGPSVLTSISNMVSPAVAQAMGIGSTTTNVTGRAGSGMNSPAAAAASQSNAMSAALMPSYGDKQAAGDLALGAMTGVASVTTGNPTPSHIADHSAPGSTNVHVSTAVTSTKAGVDVTQTRLGTNTKSRFAGGQQEASMGGKERQGGEKPAGSKPAPDTPEE